MRETVRPTAPTGSCTRRAALLAIAAAPSLLRAQAPRAAPAELAAELPGAQLRGSGRLSFFGLHIYDAHLWVSEGFLADRFARSSLALELRYARSLRGDLIAERSLQEMKRANGFSEEQGERWLGAMRQILPDVGQGGRITGVLRPDEALRFFHNAKLRGEVRDAEFAHRFIGIWLAPQTSEPKLRQALLGLQAP